jgi:hypothetical protein
MATACLLSLTARRLGGVLTLILVASAGPISAQDEDTPLRAPAGPYRGTVIDEKTGQPVLSAAVVILWQRLDDQIQGLRRLAAAQEAFTNEKGEFVHDVAATEGRLPPRTFAPRIIIFRPGYAPLPSKPQLFPPGVAASRFSGAGSQVRLVPVADYEDRAEAFNTFIAMLSASQLFPATELPETWDLIRFELESLGARPPKPPAPGGTR